MLGGLGEEKATKPAGDALPASLSEESCNLWSRAVGATPGPSVSDTVGRSKFRVGGFFL